MKKNLAILTLIMAFGFFTGCTGSKAVQVGGLTNPLVIVSPGEAAGELQSGVKEANKLCESGNHSKAIRKYDELLARFNSEGRKIETSLLTAISMCYLENGNQNGFLMAANRLDEVSQGVKYLSHETQVILKLRETMAGYVKPEDLRIEQRISSSFKELFETEEQ